MKHSRTPRVRFTVKITLSVTALIGIAVAAIFATRSGAPPPMISNSNGPVRRCTEFNGYARPAEDQQLVVAEREQGSPDYYFVHPTVDELGRWSTPLTLGDLPDTGHQFRIYAFYLDKQDVTLLFSARTVQSSRELPLRATDVVTQSVVRDAHANEPGCPYL